MMIFLVLPDIPAEDKLLARARQGDQNAIMSIYEGYFPPIFNFIRLRVEDARLAEDLASDVFLRFIEAVGGPNAPRHSLRGWLFRVARNELYQHYGQPKAYPMATVEEWLPTPPDDDPEVQFIRSMDIELARQAIRMLVDEQQEVLILRFGQMLSLRETADIMDKSVSAIKSLQFRAVNALRRVLNETRAEPSHG